jgi:hypothetical protein
MDIRKGTQEEKYSWWEGKTEAKGFWTPLTSDGAKTALLICPTCGLGATLKDHHIADDGTVTPSVVCPSCTFHEFVRLLDWKS